ncbi:FMN-dependent NADH-azoreductase [Chitinimonas arctica]|uniref:FMN dependent NADH:quinone oxidoreductase n=1 Tax=Chitinimonas arctica TaxID=2594795 RepID=A0A516SKP6_9NEIS|nr:FMN-dependent NADH-azoreductase [Chitinimonas arctica]QDQ28731.1 FMN-dependent NADH-azoreductase [Chitinimonas arctica]
MKLLQIDSSILGEASVSRQLTRDVVEAWRTVEPGLALSYRDLGSEAPPHQSGASLAAYGTPAELRDAAQQHEAALSAGILDEFLAADAIVIAAPMYNFSIPSQLKAWIDRISVAGKTFRYGPNGPEGLVAGKRAIIVATAGGKHAGLPSGMGHVDFLKVVLGFLGITDITVIHAEGLNMGPAPREAALHAAGARIRALAEVRFGTEEPALAM